MSGFSDFRAWLEAHSTLQGLGFQRIRLTAVYSIGFTGRFVLFWYQSFRG